MSENTRSIDRRTALELLAGGLTTGVAGCIGSSDTTTTPDSTSTTPAATTPTATATQDGEEPMPTATPGDEPALPDRMAWMFATGVMKSPWSVPVARLEPSTYIQNRKQANETTRLAFADWSSFVSREASLDSLEMDEVIATRGVYVVSGDFTGADVALHLADTGYENQGPQYDGFVMYAHPEKPWAFGVGDNRVIATEKAGSSMTPVQVLRRLVDTKRGVAERLHEEYPYIGSLARWIGTRTWTVQSSFPRDNDREPAGNIGVALSYEFTDDGVDARFVAQFTDSVAITDSLVQQFLENRYKVVAEWSDRTRKRHGNVVVIDGKVSYESMLVDENIVTESGG